MKTNFIPNLQRDTHLEGGTGGSGPCQPHHSAHQGYSPLTKREYFAAMALQGMIARYGMGTEMTPVDLANKAVKAANLLIKSLNNDLYYGKETDS